LIAAAPNKQTDKRMISGKTGIPRETMAPHIPNHSWTVSIWTRYEVICGHMKLVNAAAEQRRELCGGIEKQRNE
jgi:hypothetical protein